VAHDLFFRLPDLDSVDRMRSIGEVAALDWSRSNEDMIEIGVLSRVDGVVGMSGRGVAAVESLHKYIRENTSLAGRLPKDEEEPEMSVA
jgi:hypothetical protein